MSFLLVAGNIFSLFIHLREAKQLRPCTLSIKCLSKSEWFKRQELVPCLLQIFSLHVSFFMIWKSCNKMGPAESVSLIVCLSASFGLSIHIALSASLNLSLSASRRTVWIARKAITSARSLDVDPIILLTTVVVDMPWRRRRCLSVLTSAATQIYLPAIDTLVTGMTTYTKETKLHRLIIWRL